jgi:hypothetical protein
MFFIGFCLGIGCTLVAGMIWGSHITKDEKQSTDKLIKNIELMGSVKYRFTRVNEITEQQLNLIGRAERPSASAAHSRSKNDIVGQIKALEEEKIEIFRSILKDGLDPKLQIMIEGKPQIIKMSEAVAMHDGTMEYPQPETDPIKPRNNGLKLVHNIEEVHESSNPEVPGPRS